MKVAIPLFHDRVSPRFDFAPTLMVATIENNQVVSEEKINLKDYNLIQRSNLLQQLGVDTLICGGVQDFLIPLLGNKNVRVITPVIGEAREVLQQFLKGNLHSPFAPFCPKLGCRRWRKRNQGRERRNRTN